MITAVPKKRRVLFIINQFFRGGAETALVNLLRTMDSARFDVDLLIFDMIDLPGSLSLIPEIPDWVHVVNAAENEKKAAFAKKAVFKLERKLTGTQPFRRAAIRYLQGREAKRKPSNCASKRRMSGWRKAALSMSAWIQTYLRRAAA